MRKLLPILALLGIAACQPKASNNHNDSTSVTETPAGVLGVKNAPNRFYKQFKGTVAGKPATLQLIRSAKNNFSGYYVYDSIGEPIRLFSRQDTTGFLILLEEDPMGDAEKMLKGKLVGDTYAGEWTGNGKSYPFSLKEDNSGIIEMQLITAGDTVRVRNDDPESASATSTVEILWPVGGAPEQTLQMIRDSLTQPSKQRFTKGEEYARSVASEFTASSIGDLKDVDTTYARAATNHWDAHVSDVVVWNKYPLLAVEQSYYEYTGGAHGNGGSRYTVFDLSKNKALTLGDVFKPGYEAVVSKALEKSVRKKYNIKPEEGLDAVLFDKTIKPNDNFYLTDKYITFSYTPYEIAAYAAGQISLAIPLSELTAVLK